MKKGTIFGWVWKVFVVAAMVCIFFAMPVRAEAAARRIPNSDKMAKIGNVYLSRSTTNGEYDGTAKTVFYKANSAKGAKKIIATTKKAVTFAVSDGKYIYYDLGTYTRAAGKHVTQIRKMSIATGKSKCIAKITEDHCSGIKNTGWYSRYACFGPYQYVIDGGIGLPEKVVRVDLKTGDIVSKKGSFWEKTASPYGSRFLFSMETVVPMESLRYDYMDILDMKQYTISKNVTPPGSTYDSEILQFNVQKNNAFFFENTTSGGVRAVQYNLETHKRKNLSGNLPNFARKLYEYGWLFGQTCKMAFGIVTEKYAQYNSDSSEYDWKYDFATKKLTKVTKNLLEEQYRKKYSK